MRCVRVRVRRSVIYIYCICKTGERTDVYMCTGYGVRCNACRCGAGAGRVWDMIYVCVVWKWVAGREGGLERWGFSVTTCDANNNMWADGAGRHGRILQMNSSEKISTAREERIIERTAEAARTGEHERGDGRAEDLQQKGQPAELDEGRKDGRGTHRQAQRRVQRRLTHGRREQHGAY